MTIPFVDLARRHDQAAAEVESRVLAVLRSGQWMGGPVVAEAEATLAAWLGRSGSVGVASGTDALVLALQAAGVGPGDEVLVPALTFFATAGAVGSLGATPVVVDVAPDGLLDPRAAADAVGPQTRAVIPVHLFGNRAPAPDLDLVVIDDAAQAVGTVPAPSVGELTAVSAYPTKAWGAAGDAGFVVADDEARLDRVRRLANHGMGDPHHHHRVAGHLGRASRLDAMQAAVLLGHAPHLAARTARRRQLAQRYDAGLPDGIVPLPRQAGSSVSQYCVLATDRPRAVAALSAARIGHAIYYPRPLDQQPALQGFRHGPTPVATSLCRQLLALPIDPGLSETDIDRVLEVLHG